MFQALGIQYISFLEINPFTYLHASFKYAVALRIKAGNYILRAHIFSTPLWLKYGDRFYAL